MNRAISKEQEADSAVSITCELSNWGEVIRYRLLFVYIGSGPN